MVSGTSNELPYETDRISGSTVGTTRVGVREFRRAASTWIRRAESGERIVITVNGSAVAQMTDLSQSTSLVDRLPELEDLALAGLVDRPANGADVVPPISQLGATGTSVVPADVQVDRVLAYVRGQQVRSR